MNNITLFDKVWANIMEAVVNGELIKHHADFMKEIYALKRLDQKDAFSHYLDLYINKQHIFTLLMQFWAEVLSSMNLSDYYDKTVENYKDAIEYVQSLHMLSSGEIKAELMRLFTKNNKKFMSIVEFAANLSGNGQKENYPMAPSINSVNAKWKLRKPIDDWVAQSRKNINKVCAGKECEPEN